VRASRRDAHDVFDARVANEKGVADQRAMAAPGHRFRTHDSGALLARHLQQVCDTGAKFFRAHIIGVAAEGSVAPAEIYGIFFCVAPSAQAFQVHVLNSVLAQRSGQLVGIELQHAARFGNAAHVDQKVDAVGLQDRHELFDGARGMPDRKNCQFIGVQFWRASAGHVGGIRFGRSRGFRRGFGGPRNFCFVSIVLGRHKGTNISGLGRI